MIAMSAWTLSTPNRGSLVPLEACPKCGGTAGHRHDRTAMVRMVGKWGRDHFDAADMDIKPVTRIPEKVQCIECEFRVKFEKATGGWGSTETIQPLSPPPDPPNPNRMEREDHDEDCMRREEDMDPDPDNSGFCIYCSTEV